MPDKERKKTIEGIYEDEVEEYNAVFREVIDEAEKKRKDEIKTQECNICNGLRYVKGIPCLCNPVFLNIH